MIMVMLHYILCRELIYVDAKNKEIGFLMTGYVTNANYSMKKLHFMLFINRKSMHASLISW